MALMHSAPTRPLSRRCPTSTASDSARRASILCRSPSCPTDLAAARPLGTDRLADKSVKRVLDAAIDLAARGADPETQQVDEVLLRRAEERFTLIIDELAPSYVGGYTNRANVRVALKDYEGAVRDYSEALRNAPLGKDAWLTKVNRGATLLAMGRSTEALVDLEQAVTMSKADYLALLSRGSALHTLGRYAEAAADYGAVLDKQPADIQPFWLRYGLELWQIDRQPEALGIVRRVTNKFDLEPECAIATSSLLYADGVAIDRDEALRRWNLLPAEVRQKALDVDIVARQWPPAAVDAASAFREAVRAQ
mmetsp:Transcript_50509/g.139851  ORF Transcript_50509/g.139851 Transcript_50509/m.139851 type:complete len:309 (-) Transcript_50509:369-1295(-)